MVLVSECRLFGGVSVPQDSPEKCRVNDFSSLVFQSNLFINIKQT